MNAIETHNLTRRYRSTVALVGIDLVVEQGAIFGFIGPNGAGKTTTLRMLAGLLEPSSGTISLLGRTLDQHGQTAQQLVGYMPDFFGVYDDLRVWEYLDFWARCHNLPAARRRKSVDDLLDLVDLTPKRNAFVQTLSRGMQQRLCLAHTLVHDPPILLLDEPASGLDPRGRLELLELLRTLRDMGKTIVLSSHILSELAEVCTQLGIIRAGQLVASGTLEDVRRTLGGGSRLRIAVQRDAAAALALVEGFPGVEHAAFADDVVPASDQPATVIADWSGDDEGATALLARLVTDGIAVRSFSDDGGDLEDLFLQLTAQEVPA